MDATDRRILRSLQKDGRITNADLAKQVSLSPAACFERVRRLQHQGFIKKYAAILDPEKLDRGLLIFVEVVLEKVSGDTFGEFARAAQRFEEILECHMVAGGFDYLIKVRVKDMTSYREFLGRILTKLPGIRETHTYTVMEEVKSTTELKI